jgi:hypothetical protein
MTKGEELELIERVNVFFNVDVRSRSRKRRIVDVRHAMSSVLRELGYKLEYIGSITNRDHCSVMNSCKMSNQLCETDRDFKLLYDSMRSLVNDFHNAFNIRSVNTESRGRASFAKLYSLLLRRTSTFITHKELLTWLDAAKITEVEYKNLSRTSDEPIELTDYQ